MQHRGYRSNQGLHKRFARRIIFGESFHDREESETISRTNIQYRDPGLETRQHPFAIVNIEHGEVLHDERARGTMD